MSDIPEDSNVPKKRFTAPCYQYIIWHADLTRDTQTKEEYAEEHGVNRKTLWRWEQLDGFWEEVDIVRKEFMKGMTTDVIKAVYRDSLSGKPKAQELFLTISGHYVKKSEVKNTGRQELVVKPEDEAEARKALEGLDV